MTIWILTCPNCGTENQIPKQAVVVKCGIAHCHCSCSNCKQEFDSQQDYSLWLGLTDILPTELEG
jgi:hypothetical protein